MLIKGIWKGQFEIVLVLSNMMRGNLKRKHGLP